MLQFTGEPLQVSRSPVAGPLFSVLSCGQLTIDSSAYRRYDMKLLAVRVRHASHKITGLIRGYK